MVESTVTSYTILASTIINILEYTISYNVRQCAITTSFYPLLYVSYCFAFSCCPTSQAIKP